MKLIGPIERSIFLPLIDVFYQIEFNLFSNLIHKGKVKGFFYLVTVKVFTPKINHVIIKYVFNACTFYVLILNTNKVWNH